MYNNFKNYIISKNNLYINKFDIYLKEKHNKLYQMLILINSITLNSLFTNII